jgi:hypothetical protein
LPSVQQLAANPAYEEQLQKVQTNAVAYDYLDDNRSKSLKGGQLAWMYFPRKDKISFAGDGFDLLKAAGTLMSRYHWL